MVEESVEWEREFWCFLSWCISSGFPLKGESDGEWLEEPFLFGDILQPVGGVPFRDPEGEFEWVELLLFKGVEQGLAGDFVFIGDECFEGELELPSFLEPLTEDLLIVFSLWLGDGWALSEPEEGGVDEDTDFDTVLEDEDREGVSFFKLLIGVGRRLGEPLGTAAALVLEEFLLSLEEEVTEVLPLPFELGLGVVTVPMSENKHQNVLNIMKLYLNLSTLSNLFTYFMAW